MSIHEFEQLTMFVHRRMPSSPRNPNPPLTDADKVAEADLEYLRDVVAACKLVWQDHHHSLAVTRTLTALTAAGLDLAYAQDALRYPTPESLARAITDLGRIDAARVLKLPSSLAELQAKAEFHARLPGIQKALGERAKNLPPPGDPTTPRTPRHWLSHIPPLTSQPSTLPPPPCPPPCPSPPKHTTCTRVSSPPSTPTSGCQVTSPGFSSATETHSMDCSAGSTTITL